MALTAALAAQQERRYLYVAIPGVDEDNGHRGVSILMFDIQAGHTFVRHFSVWPAPAAAQSEPVRGIAASPRTGRLYISTVKRLAAIDLLTEKVVWENNYDGHCCERVAISPDGMMIYAPSFGSAKWFVIDAASGALRATIDVMGWPRATKYSRDGRRVYLAAWESPMLSIVATETHKVVKQVGPFTGFVCPFTVNAKDSLVFATVDGLLGFQVADLQTGLVLDSVAIEGSPTDRAAEYECPSHGIAFTRDEKELWVADGIANRLHIFNATIYPPVHLMSLGLPAQPRWITFSIDGRYAYSSTGDIIDVATKARVSSLRDEKGLVVRSEKLLEIDFVGGKPVRVGQ
jgi:DNA-binding beta-propeller fold protein YncE